MYGIDDDMMIYIQVGLSIDRCYLNHITHCERTYLHLSSIRKLASESDGPDYSSILKIIMIEILSTGVGYDIFFHVMILMSIYENILSIWVEEVKTSLNLVLIYICLFFLLSQCIHIVFFKIMLGVPPVLAINSGKQLFYCYIMQSIFLLPSNILDHKGTCKRRSGIDLVYFYKCAT